jgi:hypothetical protein
MANNNVPWGRVEILRRGLELVVVRRDQDSVPWIIGKIPMNPIEDPVKLEDYNED